MVGNTFGRGVVVNLGWQFDGSLLVFIKHAFAFKTDKVLLACGAGDMAEVGYAILCRNGDVAWHETLSEEGMVENFVKTGTVVGVGGKDGLNEGSRVRGDGALGGEVVFIITNPPWSV